MRLLPPALSLLAFLSASWVCSGQPAAEEPVWYPPTEPSPFIPDDARWIRGGHGKVTYLRGTWQVGKPVQRAVLVTGPSQTVRLSLDGQLLLEAHDTHQASPEWVDVTGRLQPGLTFVAAHVHSEWRPALYVQMRVQYQDGSWEDLVTDTTWQWCDEPAEDWATNPRAEGEWKPVEDGGGYYVEGGAFWGREFALLPTQKLHERFAAHNAKLQAMWPSDRTQPGLKLTQPAERPEWNRQFSTFCHLDEPTGQLIDGAGQVRHLFFTIYNQHGALGASGFDLSLLEQDLDLMAQADVHLYVRMTGWGWLLTKDGEWAPLDKQPPGAGDKRFERGIDLLDHFVTRAAAHGRYIVFEGDFFWSAHGEVVPPPYRSRYHLYPEVQQAQALATRRIMNRYRDCTNVLGMMIGEEDIVLAHDLDNPHQHELFIDYLQRKYGTLEQFKRQTPWGYDYADRSGFVQRDCRAERWPGSPTCKALMPGFQPRIGAFEAVKDWQDIDLPLWPWQRSPENPAVRLESCKSYNQFTPEDPLWIDFYEMREDELLFDMLSRWAQIVRQGMPRQLLFYSNAQDYTNSWHFLHLFRRAELPFDVIGVGCHDSGKNLSEIPPAQTVRKAIKVISSYRPYALAPGSPARGIASGEGEGGRLDQPGEVLNYYRGALFQEIGGGAAWTQTYTWEHICGRSPQVAAHKTPLLEWMSAFMPAVQGVQFALRRPVQVLIVRNTDLAHSNMSGLDYANARSVAEALTQLNVEFDIVMDRDLVHKPVGREATFKIDLSPYRLVILPSVAMDCREAVWEALDAWLADPEHAGHRALAFGWIGQRGSRLQPTEAFHPMIQRWTGLAAYPETVSLQGRQELNLDAAEGPRSLQVDFGRVPPVGVFTQGRPLLTTAEGKAVAASFDYGANTVYAFGFPMGLAHEPLWGLEPQQEPRDAVVPVYEHLAAQTGIDRPILAPHNLRLHVSDGGEMILLRERAGIATDTEVAVRLPAEVSYPDLELGRGEDGYTRFRVSVRPWEGLWWKATEAVAH